MNEYIYLDCRFNEKSSRPYTYKTTDKTIRPGDMVTVETKDGHKVVDVVAIREDFDENTLSFPIKEIVGKVQPPAGTTIKTETEVEDDLEDEGELP